MVNRAYTIIVEGGINMKQYEDAYFDLDRLLKDRGMSKTALSYDAKITHTQINKICSNKVTRIDLATITRICAVLECGIEDLIILKEK